MDEETLLIESINALDSLHDEGQTNKENIDSSKMTMRYKADEPGNISRSWWVHGASQVSRMIDKLRNLDNLYRKHHK